MIKNDTEGLLISKWIKDNKDMIQDSLEDESADKEIDRQIIEAIEKGRLKGVANDFHNLAVSMSRIERDDLAYNIVKYGLEKFPQNTDLLGDLLHYSVVCEQIKESIAFFVRLRKIPFRLWQWRAYAFSIEFLQNLFEAGLEDNLPQEDLIKPKGLFDDLFIPVDELHPIEQTMIAICEEFYQRCDKSEEPMFVKATIYDFIGDKKGKEKVLSEAIKLDIKTPKCALEYADDCYQNAEYKEALEAIEKGIKDSIYTVERVNTAYLFYLKGLALYSSSKKDNNTITKSIINEIFNSFDIAIAVGLEKNDEYVKVLVDQVKLICSENNCQVLKRNNKLNELLQNYN